MKYTAQEKLYLDDLEISNPNLFEIEKRRIVAIRQSFNDMLDSKSGRRVIWWMISECQVFSLSMTGNSWSNFNEGKRSIGLNILNQIIAANPKKWIQLQEENIDSITANLEIK